MTKLDLKLILHDIAMAALPIVEIDGKKYTNFELADKLRIMAKQAVKHEN